METRSKAQRDTVEADTKGSGFITSEGDTHPACDPSPPVLTPVGIRATPVLTGESSHDAEQHQEHTDLQHRLGLSTLEPPVRIDPVESVVVRPTASGPLVPLINSVHCRNMQMLILLSLCRRLQVLWEPGLFLACPRQMQMMK